MRSTTRSCFFLLASELPQAVDGPAARAWIAEHDVIDHGLLGTGAGRAAPQTMPRRCGTRAPGGAGCGSRSTRPLTRRPDAWCSPGREHVHNGACRCRGSSRTAPGWEYQFTAAIGHLRTAWAALVDVARTAPATRTAQTIAQVKNVLRRLRAAGHGAKAAPLFVFDAGDSAAALTDGLPRLPGPRPGPARRRQRVLRRSRHLGGQVRPSRPPRGGGALPGARGLHRGRRARAAGPEEAPAPEPRTRRGRSPCPIPRSTAPSAPRPGTGVHPLIHGDRGWFAGRKHLPVLRGTLIHVTVERLPDGRDPHRAMWLWHAGPGPLSLDELWRAYLARFDIEHAFKLLKGTLGLTAAKVSAPEQADRWARLLMAALRPAPARPAPGRRPAPALGETPRSRPAAGHRAGSAGGFATSAATWEHPPVSRNPPDPGQAGPKAAAKAQLPATFSPAKPACRAPQTRR